MPVYAVVVAKGGPKLQGADLLERDCPSYTRNANVGCHILEGGQPSGVWDAPRTLRISLTAPRTGQIARSLTRPD